MTGQTSEVLAIPLPDDKRARLGFGQHYQSTDVDLDPKVGDKKSDHADAYGILIEDLEGSDICDSQQESKPDGRENSLNQQNQPEPVKSGSTTPLSGNEGDSKISSPAGYGKDEILQSDENISTVKSDGTISLQTISGGSISTNSEGNASRKSGASKNKDGFSGI